MNNLDSVSDPSDWDKTRFPQLSELDAALRCQICKEFLKAPVLTSCGHIFCSICIRRTISETNKCPVCLDETYESGLRKVLLLDSIVSWFDQNRMSLLDKLPLDHVNDSQNEESSDIELVSASELNEKKSEFNAEEKKVTTNDENLTECPICGVFMPITEIQGKHIDQCLKSPAKPKGKDMFPIGKERQVSAFFSPKKASIKSNAQLQPKHMKGKQRLANLDTSLSTPKLKERMNSYHLPTTGTRQQLEHRMKEYISLYNANLDSINPLDERVLRDKLNKWEALISSKGNAGSHNKTSNAPPITYDEQTIKRQKVEHKTWNNKNKNHYADLIKIARQNLQKRKSREAQTKSEEIPTEKISEEEIFPDDEFTEAEKEILS